MKVLVLIKATAASESGALPSGALLGAIESFNEELVKAGILLAAEGLQPSARGKRVRFIGTRRDVTDGPFDTTPELVSGFWLWQVKSVDEAVEWAKRCPNPMPGEAVIEIRPVSAPEDPGARDRPQPLHS